MDSTYNHQYSDFLGGISTLPLNKRTANQTEDLLNCVITERGLSRRNPFSRFNADAQLEDSLAFSWDRDNRSYLLILSPIAVNATTNTIEYRLYDDRGARLTIDKLAYFMGSTLLDDYSNYPNTATVREAFNISVIKDVLFITNRFQKPTMTRVKYPSESMEDWYLMYFKESTTVDGGYHYYITVEEDGVLGDDYHYSDTRELARSMGLVPKMGNYGNVVVGHWQQHLKVGIADSNGNQASALIHEKVVRYEELPPKIGEIKHDWYYHELNDGEPFYQVYQFNTYSGVWELTERTREEPVLDVHGQKLPVGSNLTINPPADYVQPWCIVEVTEGNSDDIGGYVVCHNNTVWMECPKWGDEVEIAYNSFPIQLQYRSDTRFTLAFTPLKQKHSNCNNPSFINEHIQTTFYYKGRLGVTTKNDISLSAVVEDDQLNFFKTTMRADIPSDTLNYSISTSSISNILMVLPTQRGLYIIATDGIYANIFNSIVSQDTNTIGRLSEERISLPIVLEDRLYYLTGGSLKAIIQGIPQRVGEHFKGKLDNLIDVAVHQTTRQLFYLDADKKTIWVVKVLTTPNSDIHVLGRWTQEFDIYAIEVAGDKLIIVQRDGISATDLIKTHNTFIDEGTGAYRSEVTLPKQILRTNTGYNSLLYKYIYKRLQLFLGDGEMAIEIYRDNTLVERIEEQEVNVMQGTNQDTTIKLTSINWKPFELHFAESTLYIEQGNYKNI